MPKVVLPDGTVLVGGKADEYIRAEAKAKKEMKKKVMDARKAGDMESVADIAADLATSKAAALMSNADSFQAEVLDYITKKHRHDYTFYRIVESVDVEDKVDSYVRANLRFEEVPKDIKYFTGDATYRYWNGGITTEKAVDHILEVHPSLLKKSGKLAIDIPVGSVVAVRSETNTAQRLIKVTGKSCTSKELRDVTIHHAYICAIVDEKFLEHNMDDSRLRMGRYDTD